MADELQNEAERAAEALEALRVAALNECGFNRTSDQLDSSSFSLVWRPGMSGRELADEAMRVASECVSEFHSLRSGRVFCYGCGCASCEHAVAPDPGHVFTGYGSTGRPEWTEFFNYLLALGDPRTDQLFADRPEILSRVIGRNRLTSEQLASFGKNSLTYRIWGQVVAGYIRVQSLRAALTAQLVETRDYRLHLQVIADTRVRDALANAPADGRSAFHRIHDALSEARTQVFSLSNLWQQTHKKEIRREVRNKAFSVLKHLANSIERKGRQHRRRTKHAELRGQQQRPVHKALDDLKDASTTDFFRDTLKHSFIVLGKSGRMHVFSEQGKHITSLVIKGDELERRQRRKRFLPLDGNELQHFRDAAARAMSSNKPANGA